MKLWQRLRRPFSIRPRNLICGEILLLTLLILLLLGQNGGSPKAVLSFALRMASEKTATGSNAGSSSQKQDYIKWVDFNVSYEALNKAFRYDVDTCQAPVHLNWVNLLAYLGALSEV